MSKGSPMMSERTMEKTLAGAQSSAYRPPLTAERRFLTVFISTMSAPQASSCLVRLVSSSGGMRGFSKRAEPPPERRKSTVSSGARSFTRSMAAWVAAKEFSSGTGCPASKIRRLPMGPLACSYLVMTTPSWMRSPSRS